MIQETYGNVRCQEGMMTVADKKYLGAYQLQQRMTSLTLEETNKMPDMPRAGYETYGSVGCQERIVALAHKEYHGAYQLQHNSKLDAGLWKR